MLWETKFGHCYWAGLRCVKISIRISGVKTFMTCPLVSSHLTWWCSHASMLVPPQHCQQTAGPCPAVFLFPYPGFLVWCIFSLHFDDSGTIWVVNFISISWMKAVHFIYMKIFSVGFTIKGLATLEVLPKLYENIRLKSIKNAAHGTNCIHGWIFHSLLFSTISTTSVS